MDVIIVRTGVANIGSIAAGLQRAGAIVTLSSDPYTIQSSPYVVIPGVGAFSAAMNVINNNGVKTAILARVAKGLPTLFVCVGIQITCTESEESPGAIGLGFINAKIVRLPNSVIVPQQGWNMVKVQTTSHYISDGQAYFSNSYCLTGIPEGWNVTTTRHGIPFIATMEFGAILACQFHPELSGKFGLDILKQWLTKSKSFITPVPTISQIVTLPNSNNNGYNTLLTRRVIPCLDVKDGQVVKGIKFQELKNAGTPSDRSMLYEEQGADELVMLDISATPEGRKTAHETIKSIRKNLSIPLTVGGGIKTIEDARAILESGADKVSINTAAVKNPQILTEMATYYGRQCTVLAIDAIQCGPNTWEVVISSGKERTGKNAIEWAKEGVQRGAGEILLTSWDRDGTKSGYDLALIKAISSVVSVPVIASGGAATPEHLSEALEAGSDAVLAASIFHYGEYTVKTVKNHLKAKHLIRVD